MVEEDLRGTWNSLKEVLPDGKQLQHDNTRQHWTFNTGGTGWMFVEENKRTVNSADYEWEFNRLKHNGEEVLVITNKHHMAKKRQRIYKVEMDDQLLVIHTPLRKIYLERGTALPKEA